MANPEKGTGKLGHEGRGNEKPNPKPDVIRGLGSTAIRGSQK
jgi:hypothetical protein